MAEETSPTLAEQLATLEQHAKRISVGRSDGYIEIAVDGVEVYGFTESAIDQDDSKAVLTFGEVCVDLASRGESIRTFVDAAVSAMLASLAEIEIEIDERKASGNGEVFGELEKVAAGLRDAIALAGTRA